MKFVRRLTEPQLAVLRCAFAAIAACALLLAGCAGMPRGESHVQTPKNIIIMFADGAAPTQWEIGKYAARQLRNQSFAVTDQVFREGVLGVMSTHPANAFVTDSAAAATAMSTGTKTNNYTVGIAPDGKVLYTVMEAAKALGKKIGLVTTDQIYDASPAAFSAHAKRGEDQSIVSQYLALEPDVLIGGGRDYFLGKETAGGKRDDGRDVIAEFAKKGYQVARTPQELKAATGPRLIGLFADEGMGFESDRDPASQPTFAEMTATALRVISSNAPNGFILFVENGNVDAAGHRNDIATMIRELWAFDEGVKLAIAARQSAPAETLLIVTSDHETGGLAPTYRQATLGSYSRSDRVFVGREHFQMVDRIKGSFDAAAAALGKKPTAQALNVVIAERFPGFTLDADLREAILSGRTMDRSFTYGPQNTLGQMIARQTGFNWATSGHTTQPVLVGAMGPGAELFRGYQDNTDFGKHLHRLITGR